MKIMQHIVDQMSMTHRRLDLVFIHTYARLLHAFFSFFFLFVCNNLYEALGWSIWGLSHLCVRPRSLYSSIHLYNLSSGEREREREREKSKSNRTLWDRRTRITCNYDRLLWHTVTVWPQIEAHLPNGKQNWYVYHWWKTVTCTVECCTFNNMNRYLSFFFDSTFVQTALMVSKNRNLSSSASFSILYYYNRVLYLCSCYIIPFFFSSSLDFFFHLKGFWIRQCVVIGCTCIHRAREWTV